ncbi:hypothetical protein AB0E59_36170 [Lentzea sp. NPDC034063]|uniref:hypothetical protein n=1 Tax=unclassified Lentzea TaxID=2643253 RepID=UPI0033E91BFC
MPRVRSCAEHRVAPTIISSKQISSRLKAQANGRNVSRIMRESIISGRQKDSGRRLFRPTRWVAVVAALGVVSAGTPAFATAPQASEEGTHCVRTASGYSDQITRCFTSLRTAISLATDGRVADGPESGAELLDDNAWNALLAKVNVAGNQAKQAGGSNHFLTGIVFVGEDFSGTSHLMSTTPSFATLSGPVAPCKNYTQTATFSLPHVIPKSVATFNGCYYNTYGIEWYANDRLRRLGSPVITPIPNNRFVRVEGGPTRLELLQKCGKSCKFKFDDEGRPSERYGSWRAGDGLVNCSTSVGTYGTGWEDTVGGAIDIGVEIGVSASGGFPGAVQVEASMSTSFNQQWNWSSTLSKSVEVTVQPGDYAQLWVRPLLLDYKGHYELKFSNNFHGRKTWNIQDVTVTQPGPERALQHRIDGSAIAGSPFESWCGDTSKAGRVGGMTIVK